jgi:BirA family transcriptional regulator, biotin operon repressor / biotin---[acetyl-CoA-carboxylase] ligase
MSNLPPQALGTHLIEGWTVHEYAVVASTNPIAGQLPPWHAVRAEVQTGGRGRTGRHWVSNTGGLWLSAVVPVSEPRKKWAVLPLAVGWAVIEALRAVGVESLRLRWPNDILVGPRKLAGLLVEQFRPDAAVVGIGINVSNDPINIDSTLSGHAVNLHDLLPHKPAIEEVLALVLASLRRTHTQLAAGGFRDIARAINAHWDQSRGIELVLNGNKLPVRGTFKGVDEHGRLAVLMQGSTETFLEATEVDHLREL